MIRASNGLGGCVERCLLVIQEVNQSRLLNSVKIVYERLAVKKVRLYF